MANAHSKTWWISAATLAAVSLAIAAYMFAWKSGCTFDSKIGNGDAQSSHLFMNLAWASAIASIFSLVLVPLLWRRSWAVAAGSGLFFLVLAGPVLVGVMWFGASSGTRSCGP